MAGRDERRQSLLTRQVLGVLAPLRNRMGDQTIEFPGVGGAAAASEAEAMGWQVGRDAPLLVCVNEADTPRPVEWSGRTVVVVVSGGEPKLPDGWRCLANLPVKDYRPLGEWCDGLAAACGLPRGVRAALANFFRRTGVAHVVGARLCATRHPSLRLRAFVPANAAPVTLLPSLADRLRDAGMSALGIGHIPLFAANFASLATTLAAAGVFFFAGSDALRITLACAAVVATAIGVALEKWSARYYLAEDAREVVIDEVAGMSVTLLFLPPVAGWAGFAAAFFLFRFFDIFKWGVHWIETRSWPGTIVWDDVLAGLYAGLVLAGLTRLLPL